MSLLKKLKLRQAVKKKLSKDALLLPTVITPPEVPWPDGPVKNRSLGPYIGKRPLRMIIESLINQLYVAGELEEGFEGLSKRDVMIIRQIDRACEGSIDAFKEIMDRLYGKPIQVSESLQVHGSLQDFLDMMEEPGDNGKSADGQPAQEN